MGGEERKAEANCVLPVLYKVWRVGLAACARDGVTHSAECIQNEGAFHVQEANG